MTLDPQRPKRIAHRNQPGSVADTWTYNGFAEPSNYTATVGGSNAYGMSFNRDKLGRITQKAETVGGTTASYDYTYDLAGRLTGVETNGSTTGTYTYDANGNRLTAQSSAIGNQSCTYDAQDRLKQCGQYGLYLHR